MKTARVEAEFAELKGNNVVIAKGTATNAAGAIARAARNLFLDSKVKGRRIRTFKATFYISEEIPTIE